jgi:hypothetical protein
MPISLRLISESGDQARIDPASPQERARRHRHFGRLAFVIIDKIALVDALSGKDEWVVTSRGKPAGRQCFP